MHVTRRHQREPGLAGEPGQERVDPLLLGEPSVLDLHVDAVAAEDLDETVEIAGGVGRPVLLERLADPARQAAGQRQDARGVALEQLPVHARLVVVALQVAERRQLDQVPVALVRLGEQRQVVVPLRLPGPVVAEVHLAADQRLDALLPCLAVELDGAGERAVVRERDRGHVVLGRGGGEVRDAAGAVEDRVLGVNVEMDEGGVRHGKTILGSGQDGSRGRSGAWGPACSPVVLHSDTRRPAEATYA